MSIDKLIEELQLMKERGVDGSKEVFIYIDNEGYSHVDTIRIDSEGDLIIEGA